MADVLSSLITNTDYGLTAPGRRYNSATISWSPSNVEHTFVAILAAHNNGQIYRVCRIPSWAVIRSILVANSAITAGTDFDLGAYRTTAKGGAVIVKDTLLDGVDMSSARAQFTSLTYQKQTDLTKAEQPLWKWLSPSSTSDPYGELIDICYTANTVGSADGTILTQLHWKAD